MPSTTARGTYGRPDRPVHPVIRAITVRRVQLDISRELLAEVTGISRDTLDKLETGKHLNIGFVKLLSILDYLDLELEVRVKNDNSRNGIS